jgi:3',5'-cyclic AMP phosphodiesterase CpdA
MFYHWNEEVFDRMNHAVAYDEPDFAVLGGDLAYTIGVKVPFSGMEWQMQRWTLFLRKLQTTLKSQKNRLIPILPVVGNHDVHGKDTHQKELFFLIFPFPDNQKAYRSFYVGSYLHLVFLDTGHSASIEGEQTEWLRKELQHSQSPYLFAAYHVGAYPSVYNYKGKTPELLRKTWVPIFEKESVLAAFEHHSHAFKRTYPIKNEKIDMSGVTYLGDGSWGVPPRKVYTPQSLWYLKKSSSVNACWFVSLTEEKAFIEARTLAGEIIDQLELSPRLFEEMKE